MFNQRYYPVKCNYWLALQEIKRTYLNQADDQIKLLTDLMSDGQDIIDQAIEKMVVGASGRVYKFTKSINSNNLIIDLMDLDPDNPQNYKAVITKTVTDFFSNGGMDKIDDILSGGLTISAIISDINQGKDFNSALGNISKAFQSASTLTYSDIYSVLSEFGVSIRGDISSILSMIKSSLSKGKLSNFSWLSIINGLLTATKTDLDEDHLLLDTSKPLFVQSMVAHILLSVVPVVVSAICYALAAVIGAVMIVISSIFSAVWHLISQAQSQTTNFETDPESTTDYVKGPVTYSVVSDSVRNTYGTYTYLNKYITYDDGFVFTPMGPYHFYQWHGVAGDNNSYCNTFLSCGWDVKAVLKYIINDLLIDEDHRYIHTVGGQDYIGYVIANPKALDQVYSFNGYYLSAEQTALLLSEPNKAGAHLAMSMCIAYFINSVQAQYNYCSNFVTKSKTTSGTGALNYTDYYDVNKVANVINNNGAYNAVGTWLAHIAYFLKDSQDSLDSKVETLYNEVINDWSSTHLSSLQALFQSFYTDSFWNSTRTGPLTFSYYNGELTPIETIDGLTYDCCTDYSTHYVLHRTICNNDSSYTLRPICYSVDSLPVDRALEIPSTTTSAVIAAITLVATVAIALAAALTVTKRAINNRLIAKKTLRADELDQKRQAYLSAFSTEADRLAYVKAVKKYNLQAKVFGWGSYDPANNWFDSPSDATQAVAAATLFGSNGQVIPNLLNSTQQAINTATSLGLIDTVGSVNDNTNTKIGDYTLNDVITVLTGH